MKEDKPSKTPWDLRLSLLALTLWTLWFLVYTFYPLEGAIRRGEEIEKAIQLTYFLALTLCMGGFGLLGVFVFRTSSPGWNCAFAMSLSLPLHLLALMAESTRLAIALISLSFVYTLGFSVYCIGMRRIRRGRIVN